MASPELFFCIQITGTATSYDKSAAERKFWRWDEPAAGHDRSVGYRQFTAKTDAKA
jgi:hypothetical protein